MYAATGGPNVKWGGTDFKWRGRAPLTPPLATALVLSKVHNCTFAQWNLILVHLQHPKTLEEHEDKEKLSELNVCFVRILMTSYLF